METRSWSSRLLAGCSLAALLVLASACTLVRFDKRSVYRYDQLLILRTARMPSVLLEAGSIINRDEELLMGTDEHRLLIAGAVTDAVEAFCAQKGARMVRAIPR